MFYIKALNSTNLTFSLHFLRLLKSKNWEQDQQKQCYNILNLLRLGPSKSHSRKAVN